MPRIARKNLNSDYIHVVIQGIEKKYIFEEEKYKGYYLKMLYMKLKEFKNLSIIAYCIMDNHVHILVYCKEKAKLSKWMNQVNTAYALWYNKMKGRVGYVFRGRYQAQAIKDRKHLWNSLAYIHRNPVKARIVRNMEDYQYSSYRLYKENKIPYKIIKMLFPGSEYKKIFCWIHENFEEENVLEIEEKLSVEEINEIIEQFCKTKKITREVLTKDNQLLILVVKEIQKRGKNTIKQISELLGIGKNRIQRNLNRQEKKKNKK